MTNDEMKFSELDKLSEEEKKYALEILKELSTNGNSSKLNDILYEDYEEIPVDIETFLHNDKYLGRALINSEGKFTIFPYWEKTLMDIFPNNLDTNYNTAVFTGAIGLGKSTIAVIAVLYQLYRVMCLKNPYIHYGLQDIDLITFAFMNITLDAAKGVAWDKCQGMIQKSGWFMDRGTMSKGDTPMWKPPKGIELICGSLPRHIIGRAVFACLDGDTIILTNKGNHKIKDLVNSDIKVFTRDDNGEICLSDTCTVLPTRISNEEYHIELEDGTVIKCTPEHRFLLKNGEYKQAQYLTEEDDIVEFDPVGYVYKVTNLMTITEN